MIGPVRRVNFFITSRCNRRCPSCCSGVARPDKEKRDQPIESIVAAAKILGPIEIVTLYGGEPSFHAGFLELAPRIREIFDARQFTIATNGYGFSRFPEAFLHFDFILASRYSERTYLGCISNAAEIEGFRRFLAARGCEGKLVISDVMHVPDKAPFAGAPCYRQEMPVIAYAEGLLYRCCTGDGIPGAVGLPLAADWRDRIADAPIPCATCLFSTRAPA